MLLRIIVLVLLILYY